MLRLILALALLGCAQLSEVTQPSAKERIMSQEISEQSVLDLSRSSYLRGCVEGSALNTDRDLHFESCVALSKKHEKEIKEILEK